MELLAEETDNAEDKGLSEISLSSEKLRAKVVAKKRELKETGKISTFLSQGEITPDGGIMCAKAGRSDAGEERSSNVAVVVETIKPIDYARASIEDLCLMELVAEKSEASRREGGRNGFSLALDELERRIASKKCDIENTGKLTTFLEHGQFCHADVVDHGETISGRLVIKVHEGYSVLSTEGF